MKTNPFKPSNITALLFTSLFSLLLIPDLAIFGEGLRAQESVAPDDSIADKLDPWDISERGRKLNQEKKYEEAYVLLKKAADLGEMILAPQLLAEMYEKGLGVEKNTERAVFWHKKAANHGVRPSIISLGLMYYNGVNVPQDYKQAAFWFEKLAKRKEPDKDAQYMLGFMHLNGQGVPKSIHRALEWLEESAYDEYGSWPAQVMLGVLYMQGKVVDKDIDEAMYWLGESTGLIATNISLPLQLGFGKKEYNKVPFVSEDDLLQAIKLVEKFANDGDLDAQFYLGRIYAQGWGVTKRDGKQAVYWLKKVANQNHVEAQFELGNLWLAGIAVSKDSNRAINWLEKAAKQGHVNAQQNLTFEYFRRGGMGLRCRQRDDWEHFVEDFVKLCIWKSVLVMEGESVSFGFGLCERCLEPDQLRGVKIKASNIYKNID